MGGARRERAIERGREAFTQTLTLTLPLAWFMMQALVCPDLSYDAYLSLLSLIVLPRSE